jgi:acetolactate synthase-1/2/3 large subunit
MQDSGDLLAELLVAHGVRYVFGIPGGQTLPLYNAIGRRPGQLHHILVRDERTGPYAADAYARVTGRVAVCDAVPGPGVVKLPSGLAEAYASSVPLVAIAGDLPRDWRPLAKYGCAAQGLDHVGLLTPVCKSVISVTSQTTLPAAMRQAFRDATTGRAGPVVVNLPADVMHASWDPATLAADGDPRFVECPAIRTHPPAEAIEAAARALLAAERPVMVVGGGGLLSRAWDLIQTVAERLAMPVATTVSGKGAIREDHPLSVGVLGGQYGEECANQVVWEADVVFLVGFKSSQQSTFEWTLPRPDQRVVHLDVDPYEIGKVFRTDVALVGDAAASLGDLVIHLDRAASPRLSRPAWQRKVAEAKAAWEQEVSAEARPRMPIRPQQLVRELLRQTDPEDIMVSDASFAIGWITSFYDVRKAGRRCLFPRGSATLGFGLPASIGARLADPRPRVICLAGDGGIGYALAELATCRKYDLRIVVIVLNNGCLGYSKWGERKGERRYENVDYPPTDFAVIARGFGCAGVRVEAPDQVGDAVAEALRTEGPTVVDVVVDQWATPELRLRREFSATESKA